MDKARIYAAAGVPEYLIVDPERAVWTLNTAPTETGYRTTVTKPLGIPVELAGLQIELDR